MLILDHSSGVCCENQVDRARLAESMEAWGFVEAETPERSEFSLEGPYGGSPRGFGRSTGVLTWPNSD